MRAICFVKALPPCESRTSLYAPLVWEGFFAQLIQMKASVSEQIVFPDGGVELRSAAFNNWGRGKIV